MRIQKFLSDILFNYDNKNSLVSKRRTKRIAPLLEMIEVAALSGDVVNIIDIGGTENYWKIVPTDYLSKHQVEITIVNLPGTCLPQANETFTFVEADACDLSIFKDKSFDIAHSNSVIEHVGDWGRMVKFATELSRVSRQHFVQTPNFWFPIEPHFMTFAFHWMPKPIRVWMTLKFNLGNWPRSESIDQAVRAVESARLLDHRMLQALFKDSSIRKEYFLGLCKSLISVKKS